jgi:DNA polymerase III subunit epsilon
MDAPEARQLPQDLVFVDLETTGGNAAYHRITEVGIVRVAAGVTVEEWSTLVHPECLIPDYIESFTGITNEMVAAAPRFADLAPLVREKLGSAREKALPVFVAHNARFDYAFLRAEFRRAQIPFSAKVLCTVKLSRRLFPEHLKHNLDAVMQRHQLECSARHRALGDARVIRDFWVKMIKEIPESLLAKATQEALGRHKLPAHLPADLEDELPEGPGIYRMYGADGEPLYVGRSASLRPSILGHFTERGGSREQRLSARVRRIDWIETAGALGASLREIEALRALRPLHNRAAKAASEGFTMRIEAGHGRARIASIAEVDCSRLDECFGVFHSAKDARKALSDIAAARALCPKVLGLEESDGSCVAYQLGKCRGACTGKEPLALHAVRVHMALASLKLKDWPFPGRIALRERDMMGGAELHVFDRWSYLGSARSEEELQALASAEPPPAFDAQVYRILARYLAAHPKLDWHDLGPRRRAAFEEFDAVDVP